MHAKNHFPDTLSGRPDKDRRGKRPRPVHLEDGRDKQIVLAKRSLAKPLAPHLFTSVVRLEGVGRWTRTASGRWEMLSFAAHSFQIVDDADIRKNIGELRSIKSGWKQSKDPLEKLDAIRRGRK